jgi:O-antigen/teichoic acid export membrane protein
MGERQRPVGAPPVPGGRGIRWGGNVATSLADHGILAASSLILQIVLARQLAAAEYGAVAVAFGMLQILLSAQIGLIVEPASVLGPSRHAAEMEQYVRSTARLNSTVAVGAAIVAFLAALVLASFGGTLSAAVSGLIVCAPAQISLAFARRAGYLFRCPRAALAGSGSYAAVLGVGIAVLGSEGWLSPASALGLVALASIVGSMVTSRRLSIPAVECTLSRAQLWAENWQYGRWIFAANITQWAGSGGYVFLVGSISGLAAAGAYRAMQNLVSPIQQALAAVAVLLLPHLAGSEAPLHHRAVWRRTWYAMMGASLAYALALVLFGAAAFRLLYPGDRYGEATAMSAPFAVYVAAFGTSLAISLALRAENRPNAVFVAKAAAAAVALTCGVPLTWRFGLQGAAWGLVLTVSAESAALLGQWRSSRGA